ncbi:GNAT family N-acetyltransferase [candidate division KSB1 bacterium]|nr:GNAT family N-acetyltransferase [candidate division KSB1 bacterium]
MKHAIEIDGERRDIDIRPMDDEFIVFRKMYVPPITRENLTAGSPDDPSCLTDFLHSDAASIVKGFLEKQTRAMGSCAILAWDGDGVIGKMYFTTHEMWEAFRQAGCYLCVEHESMPRMIQSLSNDEIAALLASPSKTLHILCHNIGHFDTRYHGKGIASAVLDEMKRWAKENGWRTIEIDSCPDVVPFYALGSQHWRRSALEKRGFYLARDTVCPEQQAGFRRQSIERILTGQFKDDDWDIKTYPGNIADVKRLAETSDWEAVIDRDYVMAFDLQQ